MLSSVVDGISGAEHFAPVQVAALEAGTREVQMIDGRVPHSLLLEIFTNSGIGTEIIEG